jgi:DNA-binding Lrp family transcriptional regulator
MMAKAAHQDRYEFDDVDRQIVEQLKLNGRATHKQIAWNLKISAATVRYRIRQMEDARAMMVVAATDFAAFGYNILIAVGVEVQGRPAEAVARDLVALPQILSVNLVLGTKDIQILARVPEFSDLSQFLLGDIAAIKGVRSLSPATCVDIVKFDSEFGPAVGGRAAIVYRPDRLDRRILDLLGGDARLSNCRIAQTLGVAEGTIRSRLKRLQEYNYLTFTAITALSYLKKPFLIFIGVTAELGRVREVAQAIGEMDGIRSVIITFGCFDIHVVGLYGSLDEVQTVGNNAILALPGVRHVETSISVRQLKYDPRLAKITRPFVPVNDDWSGGKDDAVPAGREGAFGHGGRRTG